MPIDVEGTQKWYEPSSSHDVYALARVEPLRLQFSRHTRFVKIIDRCTFELQTKLFRTIRKYLGVCTLVEVIPSRVSATDMASKDFVLSLVWLP